MIKTKSTGIYNLDKILDYTTAERKIAEIKLKNKKVGLCHGGFDLLHPGHIKHFESAKKLCDYLFVSVTSDSFVSSRKGFSRPIYSDKLRAYSVASIEFVDFVVISDFKTGVEVIKKLKPNYYIKGPDFINKNTPGITAERQAIKSVNGEMRYTDDPKLSSTEIIDYIKKNYRKKVLVGIDRDGTLIEEVNFLGKKKNWKDEIKFKKKVIDYLLQLQTKYDLTFIVLTNQSGVARKYFNCETVEEINEYVNVELIRKGIKIDNWQYCPDVDSEYAELKKNEIDFDSNFVKDKTKRKPNPNMLFDALKRINKNINDFDEIIIIGDRDEDKELAINLKAKFVDVNKELIIE